MNKERDLQLRAVYGDSGGGGGERRFFGFSISAVMCTLMSHKSLSKIASITKNTDASGTPYPIPRVARCFSSRFACDKSFARVQNDLAAATRYRNTINVRVQHHVPLRQRAHLFVRRAR